jgi:hypothetical protein
LCGDLSCNGLEDQCNCESDCGLSSCGDSICCPDLLEDSCNCDLDCGATICNDGCCGGS